MVDINYKDKYKILTMDENGSLLIGHLEVKNVEYLTKLRDVLMKCNNQTFSVSERRTGCANGIDIPSVEVINDMIVTRRNFREEYVKTFYDERIYQSLYLNSILIFTSLLGELDESKYGKVSREFIKCGIFKLLPLSQIWSICSIALFKNKDSQDYELFCDVLNNGEFIEYIVDEVIATKELNTEGVFNQLKVKLNNTVDGISVHNVCKKEFLDIINCNSEMLGICRRSKGLRK